ncbi:MAG: hypothetical protein KDJ65_23315 [Anaerolineae bacterium]|nr:hypothetical protein [Anaerolineae bacterium]
MHVVEQFILIDVSLSKVMQALNDVASFSRWASVEGTISNIRGHGVGMSYDWNYSVGNFSFKGQSAVLEQTPNVLITKTEGDIHSLWTVKLNSINAQRTALHVIVEYTPPTGFIEALTDLVLHQLSNPEIAQDNMNRFKTFVEQIEEPVIVSHE